ncbi:hypothetical protein Tco_1348795 [Tanacetum coccineum]
MALPLHEQRHHFLRYEGLEYFNAGITDFEARLARIYRREVHRVHVFDFRGLSDLMAEGLSARMLMEHRDDQGVSLFTSRAWRRHFDIRGLLIHELILEFYSTFRFGQAILDLDTLGTLQFYARQIPDKGDLRDYWIWISSAGDFLGTTPSYTMIRDPILRLCHRLIACSIAGRSQAPEKVTVMDLFYLRGMDIDSHFGLLTAEILEGLTVIAPELLIVDMAELVRLQICAQFDDTWAWVAMGPKRQTDAMAGAPAVAEDAPAVDEGDQTVLTPVHAPQ